MGDQQVTDAAVGEHLGLLERRHRQAGGAVLELAAGDGRALVRLGVGTEPDAGARRQRRHSAQVSLQGVVVADGHRRLQVASCREGSLGVHRAAATGPPAGRRG
jgi:hypothetical protein